MSDSARLALSTVMLGGGLQRSQPHEFVGIPTGLLGRRTEIVSTLTAFVGIPTALLGTLTELLGVPTAFVGPSTALVGERTGFVGEPPEFVGTLTALVSTLARSGQAPAGLG